MKIILNNQKYDWKNINDIETYKTLKDISKNKLLLIYNELKFYHDDKFKRNIFNFESDRNDIIREELTELGYRVYINYDCIHTDCSEYKLNQIIYLSHHKCLKNWKKYEDDIDYFMLEKIDK
jgi:hypothetical protein